MWHRNFPWHLQRNVAVIILARLLAAQETVVSRAAAALLKITRVVDLLCVFREPVKMSLLPYNKQLYKMQSYVSVRMGRLKFLASSVRYVRERACVWSASLEMLAEVGDFSLWWGYAPSPPCDKEAEQKQLLSKIRSERPVGCNYPKWVKNPW